jgi:hypothetical protein
MLELPFIQDSTIRFTVKEHLWFLNRIKPIENRLSYPISDIGSCELFWDKNYGVKNGVLGSFNWLSPKRIKVSILGKDSPDMIISTIIHELHHKWQWERFKFLYPFLAIPFVRGFALERTALIIENEADELLGLPGLNSLNDNNQH